MSDNGSSAYSHRTVRRSVAVLRIEGDLSEGVARPAIRGVIGGSDVLADDVQAFRAALDRPEQSRVWPSTGVELALERVMQAMAASPGDVRLPWESHARPV